MADYQHELDEAQKKFWNKVWADYQEYRDSTQTKLKKVLTDHFGEDYLQHINKIEENTSLLERFARAAASMIKFGGGEMEKPYPSKNKK
jgi:hypothetical protein